MQRKPFLFLGKLIFAVSRDTVCLVRFARIKITFFIQTKADRPSAIALPPLG